MSPTDFPWACENRFEAKEVPFLGAAIFYNLEPETAQ